MKKLLFVLLLSILVIIPLASCNKDKKDQCADGHSYSNGVCTVCGEKDPNYVEKRTVKTYIDYTFDELEVGDVLDLEHDENGYFEYYEGSFTASSKDEDGNVWIQTTATDGWGLCYTNIYNKSVKVNLKNFCVSFDTRLAHTQTQLAVAADGGICILWNPQAGRYDLAMHFEGSDQGAGVGNSFNLWHAMNTDGGPFATTQQTEDWGDRGSLIDNFSMSEGVKYTITVCGKHQGIDNDGNEFFTLYLFVNDKLVCYKRDVVYWDGGFGIRGYISAYEYANFKVTDFPEVCPDGIDHYNVDTKDTVYNKVALTKLATPVATINGTTLSWNAIEGAEYYSVIKDGIRVGYTKETSFDFSEIFGEGKFGVMASPSKFGVNCSDICEVDFKHDATQIATPVLSYNAETGKVVWEAVDHADSYEIYVDGTLATTQTGLFYRPLNPQAGTYAITVKAITEQNGFLSSDVSESCDLVVAGLSAPVISREGKVVSWEAVSGADAYLVYVNENEPVQVTDCTYTIVEDDFRVSVKAIDTNGIVLDSQLSNELSSGDIINLAAPTISYNNGVISWSAVNDAVKYGIIKNGSLAAYTQELSYTLEENACYKVIAVGDGKLIKDSSASKELVFTGIGGQAPAFFYSDIANQEVGDEADFGWNEYNAKYVIKAKEDGITWIGTNDPSVFHETWFWAKQVETDNTSLVDWTYESYVKLLPASADDAMQLMFGSAATGGRYSCFFYFANGGTIQNSSMQLHKDGTGAVAQSWDTTFGGTGALGTTVELVKGEVAKITINHAKQANGKARITVFVNGVLVIDQKDLVLAVGDFCIWLNAGVDGWFGNPTVTTLAQPQDCTYVGAPIQLEAPVVYVVDDELSWDEVPFAYGYGVYMDGALVAELANNKTNYTMTEEGNYTVRTIGNGQTVLTSEDSKAPLDNSRAPLSTGLNYSGQALGEVANFSGWNAALVITEAADADGITWIGHPAGQTGSDYNSGWFWAHDLSYNGSTDYLNNYTYNCYIKPLSTDESAEGKVQLYIGTATHKYCIALCTKTGFVQVWDNVLNKFVTDAFPATFTVDAKNLVQVKHKVTGEETAKLSVYVNGEKVLAFDCAISKGDFGMDIFGGTEVYFGNPNVTTIDEIEESPAISVLNYGNENVGDLVDFSGWNAQLVVKQTATTDGVTWFGATLDGQNTYNQAWFNGCVKNGTDYPQVKNFTYTCHIMPKEADQSTEGKVQLYVGTTTKYCVALYTKTGFIQIWNNQKGGWETDAFAASFEAETDNVVKINQKMNADGTALLTVSLNGEVILTHTLATPAQGDFGMDIFSDTNVWFGSPTLTTIDRYE